MKVGISQGFPPSPLCLASFANSAALALETLSLYIVTLGSSWVSCFDAEALRKPRMYTVVVGGAQTSGGVKLHACKLANETKKSTHACISACTTVG